MNKFKVGDRVRIIPSHKWDIEKMKIGLSKESSRILEIDLFSKIDYSFMNISFKIIAKSIHVDNFFISSEEGDHKFSIHYRLLEHYCLRKKVKKLLNV